MPDESPQVNVPAELLPGASRPAEHAEVTANAAELDAQAFAIQAARIAAETRCDDVVVIDLRGLSGVADFFVLGTGTSDRQMRATLEKIAESARGVKRRPFRSSSADPTWTLADYVDVIVHLFDSQHRAYYDLDSLWGDAPRVAWQPE